MRRAFTIILVIGTLVLIAACGEDASDGDTVTADGSTPATTTPSAESTPEVTEGPKLLTAQTVGPLKITPLIVKDSGIGGTGEFRFEPYNDTYIAVKMRWENVSDALVTEFPTAQIVNTNDEVYEMTTLADPEPSLVFNMLEFKMPPHTKTGWLTFDMSGTPAKMTIYMTGDSPTEPESATWDLTQ